MQTNFKSYYSDKVQECDEARLTTAKLRRANSIVANEQLQFNQQTTTDMAEPCDNMASV